MFVPAYLGRVVLRKKYIQTGQGLEIRKLRVMFGLGTFFWFRFLPLFDHPRHLKPELESDGGGARERSQGELAAFSLSPPTPHHRFLGKPLFIFRTALALTLQARIWDLLIDLLNERQRCKLSSGVRGRAPPGNNLDFYSLKSPFLGFQVIQTGYWPDCNLKIVFLLQKIYLL